MSNYGKCGPLKPETFIHNETSKYPPETILSDFEKDPVKLEKLIHSIATDPNKDALISFMQKMNHPRKDAIISRIEQSAPSAKQFWIGPDVWEPDGFFRFKIPFWRKATLHR